MRCDYTTLTSQSLSAVTIPAGSQINTTSSSAGTLVAAIAWANAATTCSGPPARALLGAAPATKRALALAATSPWAALTVNIAVSSALAAANTALAVTGAGPVSFPYTIASWAPLWGYSSSSWVATFGSPLALASAVTSNSDAVTPPPSPVSGLTTSQQLGLGLGITLPLAAIILLVVLLAYCKKSHHASGAPSGGAAAPKAIAV